MKWTPVESYNSVCSAQTYQPTSIERKAKLHLAWLACQYSLKATLRPFVAAAAAAELNWSEEEKKQTFETKQKTRDWREMIWLTSFKLFSWGSIIVVHQASVPCLSLALVLVSQSPRPSERVDYRATETKGISTELERNIFFVSSSRN